MVASINCPEVKINNILNYDEKTKEAFKAQQVNHIASVPDTNGDEIMVLFNDSTVMKYKLSVESNHSYFIEKLKKFEAKTSFSKAHNKFKYKKKNRNQMVYGAVLNENLVEFNHFYAYNEDFPVQNPISYFKFNHRSITDLLIKKHKSFSKTLQKKSNPTDTTIFALLSLNGYMVIYEYYKMEPLLSFKGAYGGFNSMTFSDNCEMIALSGQNDCITVLDLNTMKTIVCEGHKSFVSKAIFQTISLNKGNNNNTPDNKSETSNNEPLTSPNSTTSGNPLAITSPTSS